MYKQAARSKLRFQTKVGILSVEDLFDLPLTSAKGAANLDDIARELDKKVKETASTSFVVKPAKTDDTTQLAFDIVVDVINTRLAENEAKTKKLALEAQRQRITEAIVEKEHGLLKDASLDDLKAQLASLNAAH